MGRLLSVPGVGLCSDKSNLRGLAAMRQECTIYKALQRPLIYKGFQGKFIAWGIASLLAGLAMGSILGSLTNMYLGGLVTLTMVGAGLYLTSQQQKRGLHNKTRHHGVHLIKRSRI